MKIHRSIIVSAALILALGACGSDAKSADTTVAPAPTVAATSASTPPVDSSAPATTAADSAPVNTTGSSAGGTETASTDVLSKDMKVSIGDFKYEPAMAKVAAGGTVTFTNDDDTLHTATLTGMFDTGPLATGESKAITFEKPGTYKYTCSFHPFMSGTIVVV